MIELEPAMSFQLGNNHRWQKYYIEESSSMCCSRCSGGTFLSELTFMQKMAVAFFLYSRNNGAPLATAHHSFFPTHGCSVGLVATASYPRAGLNVVDGLFLSTKLLHLVQNGGGSFLPPVSPHLLLIEACGE
jgi:hypothetical protein